ncbi:MAG: hypothetical protein R2710_28695 [Acidimicrobiales bacterium]
MAPTGSRDIRLSGTGPPETILPAEDPAMSAIEAALRLPETSSELRSPTSSPRLHDRCSGGPTSVNWGATTSSNTPPSEWATTGASTPCGRTVGGARVRPLGTPHQSWFPSVPLRGWPALSRTHR